MSELQMLQHTVMTEQRTLLAVEKRNELLEKEVRKVEEITAIRVGLTSHLKVTTCVNR